MSIPLRTMALCAVGLLATAGLPLAAASATQTTDGGGKVTICHRTSSTTNPYRRITVAKAAADGNGKSDHTSHGPTYGVFRPGYAYPSNAKNWGDIIRPVNSAPGVNWWAGAVTLDEALRGHGLVNGECRGMMAQKYYNVQADAKVPHADIIADLQEQGAVDDDATTFTAMTYDPDLGPEDGFVEVPEETGEDTTTPQPEPTAEPTTEPEPEPTSEPTAEPTTEPEPEPEPTPEPEPEPTPEPGPGPGPEPTADPQPEPDPTPDPGPEPDAGPTPRQTIDGTVWLDFDRDGRRGTREPGVPGVRVSLAPVTPLGPVAPVLLATRLAMTANPAQLTGPDGSFSFPDLPAGTYRVTAQAPDMLAVTWDSEGSYDAEAEVELPEGEHRDAHVALAGDAGMAVTLTAPQGGARDGDVLVRWAGVDGTLGTDDDVLFAATVIDGTLALAGLPSGPYRLEETDGTEVSSDLAVAAGTTLVTAVTLGAPATQPPATAPPTTAPPTRAQQVTSAPAAPGSTRRAGSLASTGGMVAVPVGSAALLLAAGQALRVASRRPVRLGTLRAGTEPAITGRGRRRGLHRAGSGLLR